jgi:hypothetical protein
VAVDQAGCRPIERPGASKLVRVTAHVHPDRSWRARALYRDIVATLAWDRPDHAAALLRAMPEGKARSYIERRRAEGERKRPRFRD